MNHGSRYRSFGLLGTALLAQVTIGAGCPSDDVDDGVQLGATSQCGG